MKVLHIYKDYYPPVMGGIEGHINLLANGLKRRGVEVEVLVSNTEARLSREVIDDIRVTRIPQMERILSAPLNPGFPYWIRSLGKHADILHFHFPNPTAEISYLVSGLKGRVVVTYHSDIVRQERLGKLYNPFLRKFLDKSRKIIATSANYMNSSKILSEYREKCEVIPLGIDTARFDPLPGRDVAVNEIQKKYGPFIVLFIGRLRYYKGLHVLLEAMRKVHGRLLVIGSGPMEKEILQKVKRLKLKNEVIFLGDLSDEEVVVHLNACNICVLPSILRSEAFGIVQLEAMACGKPMISTELGTGTSFVNQHGKTGLVIPPNDPEALAEAIEEIRKNPEIGRRYGNAGKQRVLDFFSSDMMVEKVHELYQRVIHEDDGWKRKWEKTTAPRDNSKKKIKVLRIISRLNIGGPAIHVNMLTRGLDPARFESKLVTGKLSAKEGSMSFLFDDAQEKPVIVPELQREINLQSDFRAFWRIYRMLIEENPDIVHTHTAKAGFSARFAGLIYRYKTGRMLKMVHTFHGHVFEWYFGKFTSMIFVSIERYLAGITDTVIAISDSQKEELTKKFRIAPPAKIRTIQLGFDLKPFVSCRERRGKLREMLGITDNETRLIGIVGRLVPIKHHTMFISAAKLLVERRRDASFKFVVVGDGELRSELESMVRSMNLSDHFVFCGWIKDVPMVYADLDILALTSLNEGTPVSIIESMASGVPVVATDAGGVKDLLGPIQKMNTGGFKICERGVLCRKNDEEGFSRGIEYLLGGKAAEMIRNARIFVIKTFDQKRLIQDIEDLYTELADLQNG